MTARKISPINLPFPTYSLELGLINLNQSDHGYPKWIPRFSNLGQTIEVRKSGVSTLNRVSTLDPNLLTGSYISINDARPELFLRRDFLRDFVDKGTVHMTPIGFHLDHELNYQLETANNVMRIVLSEKQYRRFGIIAKKVLSNSRSTPPNRRLKDKFYVVEVDLKDERIRKSDKRQDSLVRIFRRLNPIKQLYFRFVPNESAKSVQSEAIEKALEFFSYVLDEYAKDGFKPVPLTGCSKVNQRVMRNWLNSCQLHPSLELLTSEVGKSLKGAHGNGDTSARLMCLIDWLGFQILSIDCNKHEINNAGYWDSTSMRDRPKRSNGGGGGGGGGRKMAGERMDVDQRDDDGGDDDDVGQGDGDDCGDEMVASKSGGAGPAAVCKYDVLCSEFGGGSIDFEQVESNLQSFFKAASGGANEDVVLRALVLYGECSAWDQLSPLGYQCGHNTSVFLVQDCSEAAKSRLVTIIGVSW